MNLRELSKLVAKDSGEPVYKVEKILGSTIVVIRQQILKAQIIKLKNLLTIFIDVIPETNKYDFQKKEMVLLPRRFTLKIFPSKLLKKQINEKKTY